MILVTVGTLAPFDRLVKAMDEAVGKGTAQGEFFAQVGKGGYRPKNMKWTETIERDEFTEMVREARAIVGHAGMGTILMALDAGKPALIMPRMKSYREVVNDHQADTARKFGVLGHVLVAADETEVEAKLAELMSFEPVKRTANAGGVVKRVGEFLAGVAGVNRTAETRTGKGETR